jgi:hypothetical protein
MGLNRKWDQTNRISRLDETIALTCGPVRDAHSPYQNSAEDFLLVGMCHGLICAPRRGSIVAANQKKKNLEC